MAEFNFPWWPVIPLAVYIGVARIMREEDPDYRGVWTAVFWSSHLLAFVVVVKSSLESIQ